MTMTAMLLDRTSTELPLPVTRWLEAAWPYGVGRLRSIALSGPLRIRRRRMWLPGDWNMHFALGEGYVSDLRVGLGPLTAVRGLDLFVDGTGMTRVGTETSMGPEIDQGAFIALWAESILFPSAWASLPGLRWTPVDDTRARVELPFLGGTETATLHFDPRVTSFPVAFEADRHKVPGGPKIGWRAHYEDWQWPDGLAMPTRMVVTWDDEPGPWLDMRVESMTLDEPMARHLERARVAIAEATNPIGAVPVAAH